MQPTDPRSVHSNQYVIIGCVGFDAAYASILKDEDPAMVPKKSRQPPKKGSMRGRRSGRDMGRSVTGLVKMALGRGLMKMIHPICQTR